jgi:hypothetical protein
MGSVRVDTSEWPIVVHTSEGAMGPDDTRAFLKNLDDVLGRKERYVTVFESSKLSTFQVSDRDSIVRWMRDNDALHRRYSIGVAVVLSSGAMRFVISSVLLVYKPPSPIKVFANLPSAMAWARAQVQTDALRTPELVPEPAQGPQH